MPKYTQRSTGDGHPMLLVEDHKPDEELDVPHVNYVDILNDVPLACCEEEEKDIKGLIRV